MSTSTIIPAHFDPATTRAAFTRARPQSTSVQLYNEIANRLREHLDPIRITPARIVDLGTGPNRSKNAWLTQLREQYPDASVLASDVELSRLPEVPRRGRGFSFRPRPRTQAVVMDATQPAVRAATIDLVTSNAMLHWVDGLPSVLSEARKILRPGGLFMFSTLGADTLVELRQAWALHDATHAHVHPFPDMHDIGDQLTKAGFTDIVMDAERVTLTYATPQELLAELHSLEVGNLCVARPMGLTTPRQLHCVCNAYHEVPGAVDPPTGRIIATVELVFAHAWANSTQGALQRGQIDVAPPQL
ncbi:MAG: malonyl-CoA O-methyltransferase [Gammaproteobacteria bacterium]|jgi:malonyl-CoA O-methyltransferase